MPNCDVQKNIVLLSPTQKPYVWKRVWAKTLCLGNALPDVHGKNGGPLVCFGPRTLFKCHFSLQPSSEHVSLCPLKHIRAKVAKLAGQNIFLYNAPFRQKMAPHLAHHSNKRKSVWETIDDHLRTKANPNTRIQQFVDNFFPETCHKMSLESGQIAEGILMPQKPNLGSRLGRIF